MTQSNQRQQKHCKCQLMILINRKYGINNRKRNKNEKESEINEG